MPLLKVPVHMGLHDQELFLVANGNCYLSRFNVNPFEIKEDPNGTEVINVIGENRTTKIKYTYYDYMPYVKIESPNVRANSTLLKPKFDYLLNLFKEFPEEITKFFPDGVDIYPMFVDIETTSLNPSNGEILSIQIAFPDTPYDEEIFLVQDEHNTEKDIILKFIDLCIASPSGRKPDICVNYNGCRFDIPYLNARAHTHDVATRWNDISRTTGRIYTQSWLFNKNKEEMAEVANGFRCYDMYTLAKMDLKLAKLPSRTQKAVALFYGCKDVFDLEKDEKVKMRDLLTQNRPRFEKYARSDIKQLKYLWEIYSMRTIAEANLLLVPFMTAYTMSSGQKSYIALYREARKAGFYGLTMNQDRYMDLFNSGKYQGAIVGSWAHGYYDKIIYVDAKSMYPSIMESFNLSPDRYTLLEIIKFEDWESSDPNIIRAEGPAEAKIIYIPDDNYKVIFKFQVDLITTGYMRRVIQYFNKIRDDYKKLMKSFAKDDSEEGRNNTLQYDAMQMAAKVINNTYYGINGNRYYEIGDLPQAVFVTAMGRWCMIELIKYFGGTIDYPMDDGSYSNKVLESDTDGILLSNETELPSIDEINNHIRKRIKDVFSVPEDQLTFLMEFEGAGAIYIYKQKNYILNADENKGKLTIKGSAFVGYDKAPIIKKAVEVMANCVMFGKQEYDDAVDQCRNMDAPIESFKYTKTLKRNPEGYSGYESLSNYVLHISSTYGTKKALVEMKSRAQDWAAIRTKGDKILSAKVKKLISDVINIEELSIVMEIVSEMLIDTINEKKKDSEKPEKANKKGSFYILDLVLAYRQNGFILREDDVIEYYLTTTKEGYSIAQEVTSVAQIDKDRYLRDINRIIDRFDYANPVHRRLSLW